MERTERDVERKQAEERKNRPELSFRGPKKIAFLKRPLTSVEVDILRSSVLVSCFLSAGQHEGRCAP